MTTFQGGEALEAQIAQWRAFLRRRQASHGSDVEELEAHLRDQVAALVEAGLADDEAFLVAVKRMGSLDAMSREFAREHSERLWKQLVVASDDPGDADATGRIEGLVGHCQVDENSVESPQGIAISSELEHNILAIDFGCLPAT